jgi:hypothetical protein
MNLVLSAIRNPTRLTCTWVPTGNARAPLACIWKEAPLASSAHPSSPRRGDRSVRLDEAQLAIIPAAASEVVRVRYKWHMHLLTKNVDLL